MRKITYLLVISSMLLSIGQLTFASGNPQGNYLISLEFPSAMHWSQKLNEEDAAGFTKQYTPAGFSIKQQNLLIGFDLHNKNNLRAEMQAIVNRHQNLGCGKSSSHVILMKDDVSIFTTTESQCPNGKALVTIFKAFQRPDGQYAIDYSADPNIVSEKVIREMQQVVINAKLLPIKS